MDQFVPRSACERWKSQRPRTKQTAPATSSAGYSGYSANENAGEKTQTNSARKPIYASVSRIVSRLRIAETRTAGERTPALRRFQPGGGGSDPARGKYDGRT